MGRHVYFLAHFGLGFLLLWLLYQYAHGTVLAFERAPLSLQAAVETAYLVGGVAWGNIGWDTYKRLPGDASASLVVYAVSRTLSPVAIILPMILVGLDTFYDGHYLSWRSALQWENLALVALALAVLLTQRLYARSEKAFFYRTWTP